MNNSKNLLCIALSAVMIIACGPSQEERAAKEKAKMDSVASATEANVLRQQAIQDSIRTAAENAKQHREEQQASLIELKSRLAAAEDKMQSIKQFQLGRSTEERENQIASQTTIIEELRGQISDLEKELAE